MSAATTYIREATRSDKRVVAIYRNQLFKPSEPFIALQARHLVLFQPVFVGRERWSQPDEAKHSIVIEPDRPARKIAHALLGHSSALNRQVASCKPTIVHAHFGIDALYGASLARSLDIPLVATLHGFDVTVRRIEFMKTLSPSLIRYGLFRQRLAKSASRLLCVSEFIRRKAIEFGFPEERLQTHYIGIDLRQFTPVPRTRSDVFRILHVARLVEKKGTRYLIEALARLPQPMLSQIRLDIVGDGPLRAQLEEVAKRHALTRNVTFHGTRSQSEIRADLANSDVLCLPSVTAGNGDAEGLGMVVLEAAACSVPVVATQHGGIPEAVVDGETGLLLAERDVSALADAITFLVRNEQVRAQMGRNGRAHVERRFDVVKQCAALEDIYSEVAEAR